MGSGFIPTNHAPKGTALISLALKRRVLRAGWIKTCDDGLMHASKLWLHHIGPLTSLVRRQGTGGKRQGLAHAWHWRAWLDHPRLKKASPVPRDGLFSLYNQEIFLRNRSHPPHLT